MAELLAAIIAFPAVIPTVLLGVALLYWLLVMFGALDIDLFSGEGAADGLLDGAADGAAHGLLHGAADAAAEGALDGVVDGAADGVLDGVADGAADGVLDGVADGAADGAHAIVHAGHADALVHGADGGLDGVVEAAASHGSVFSLLSLANFRSVPVTVMLSVLTVFTWLICVMGVGLLPVGLGGLPSWLLSGVVLVLSFFLSLFPTAVVIRPMARFFEVHSAKSHKDMVGHVCEITTGTVGPKFGQARLRADDLDLIVQVRQDKSGTLKRGDRALIVSWDRQREAFVVVAYDNLVDQS